jgi:hypothetical protein
MWFLGFGLWGCVLRFGFWLWRGRCLLGLLEKGVSGGGGVDVDVGVFGEGFRSCSSWVDSFFFCVFLVLIPGSLRVC